MTSTLIPTKRPRVVLEESLLDDTAPCSWHGGDNHEPRCEAGAEYVRVCPKCSYHRFRCSPHYTSDLNRPPEKHFYCQCGHHAPASELNATFRPV